MKGKVGGFKTSGGSRPLDGGGEGGASHPHPEIRRGAGGLGISRLTLHCFFAFFSSLLLTKSYLFCYFLLHSFSMKPAFFSK